jgi:hypothetical protein
VAKTLKKKSDTQALFEKAYKFVKSGATTKEACKKAGIPLPTYYYNLRKLDGKKGTPKRSVRTKQRLGTRLPKDSALLMIIPLAKAQKIVSAIAQAAKSV